MRCKWACLRLGRPCGYHLRVFSMGIRDLSLESAYATSCANASSSGQNCTGAYEVVPRHLVSCGNPLLRVSRVNCQEVARRWKESRHTSRCLLLVMENGDGESQVIQVSGQGILRVGRVDSAAEGRIGHISWYNNEPCLRLWHKRKPRAQGP